MRVDDSGWASFTIALKKQDKYKAITVQDTARAQDKITIR